MLLDASYESNSENKNLSEEFESMDLFIKTKADYLARKIIKIKISDNIIEIINNFNSKFKDNKYNFDLKDKYVNYDEEFYIYKEKITNKINKIFYSEIPKFENLDNNSKNKISEIIGDKLFFELLKMNYKVIMLENKKFFYQG